VRFYKLFKWKEPLESMGFPNSHIFMTIHIGLILVFVFIATLSIMFAPELGRSAGLSLAFNTGLALLWFWRTVWQAWYFRGGRRTARMYVLVGYFTLLTASYAVPVLLKLA